MLSLFFAFGFLASAISANKVLLYALKPEFLVGIRMTVAGIILALYISLHVHRRLKWNTIKAYLPLVIVVALFTTYFPANLKAYALANMPSAKMAFFGTLDPFVTTLITFLFFRERLTFNKILGILIGFAGMMILIFGSSPLEGQLRAFSVFSYPELAAFWAMVLSRCGWILAQQLLKKEVFSPLQINSVIMLIGGVVSLMTAFLRDQMGVGDLKQTALPLFSYAPLSALSSQGLLAVFLGYTTVVGNIFGYTLYAHGLKRYSALFISLASFCIPIMVAFFGWLFLNEPLSLSFFLACAVTSLGLLVFYLDERRANSI